MENSLALSESCKALIPAGLKAIAYKVVDIGGEFYVFLETNCKNTFVFKVVQYFGPFDETKELIKDIISGYSAWFDFRGTLFPSPYRIGLIWLGTFRSCVGCSTKEQCLVCLWAALNTILAFLPGTFPPRIMYYLANFWVGHAYEKLNPVYIFQREEALQKLLLNQRVYGQF